MRSFSLYYDYYNLSPSAGRKFLHANFCVSITQDQRNSEIIF